MKTYLTKEQILERIQALPKKSKYLTREEINQRINLACELDNYIHRIQSQIYCFWFLITNLVAIFYYFHRFSQGLLLGLLNLSRFPHNLHKIYTWELQ